MEPTIRQLANEFEVWSQEYYRRSDGTPTRQHFNVRDAMRELTGLSGDTPAAAFGLRQLHELQRAMVESGRLSRPTINARIRLVRQLFTWAANRGLVDELQPHRLSALQPLQRGRTRAKEPVRVQSVSWDDVLAAMPHCSLQVATMIELQWWTAMRPGEVCGMRKSEIYLTAPDLWHYMPGRHKTAHFNIKRRISLGPISINLIQAWAPRSRGDLLFEGGRHTASGRPMHVMAYRNAVVRACKAAGIPTWTPNRLRHSALTRTYQDFDVAHAMEQAGHTTERTTRIYIDSPTELTLADHVAKERG